MVLDTVKWFHQVMGHPWQDRLHDMLKQQYHHPALHRHIDNHKCQDSQCNKTPGRGFGLLPKREVWIAPWEEVAVDFIGPWTIKVNGRQVEFNALICIDTVSNLVKLIRINNKTSTHVRDKFTQCWLCHYPRPVCCVHYKGREFIGSAFQWLLKLFTMKDVCSTSKNPQSNTICEQIHWQLAMFYKP